MTKWTPMTKCKVCKSEFVRRTMSHKTCSLECALTWLHQVKVKEKSKVDRLDRVKTKKTLESLKTRSNWMKDAQQVFNEFIRNRDKTEPCISCQRFHQGQYHAGHFVSVGSRPNLRFNEQNVHKQCAPCNNHLSGNIIQYRMNLIKKIGIEAVVQLETDFEPKKYTIDELKEIVQIYRKKVKMLKTVD